MYVLVAYLNKRFCKFHVLNYLKMQGKQNVKLNIYWKKVATTYIRRGISSYRPFGILQIYCQTVVVGGFFCIICHIFLIRSDRKMLFLINIDWIIRKMKRERKFIWKQQSKILILSLIGDCSLYFYFFRVDIFASFNFIVIHRFLLLSSLSHPSYPITVSICLHIQ